MNTSSLEFFLLEAFRGLRRSGMMALVAVGIIAVSLWVFGSFLLIMANLGNFVSHVGSQIEVAGYANGDLTLQQASAIQAELTKIAGVDQVRFISRDEAWGNFQKDFGGKLELGEAFRSNPLPNTFIVEAKSPAYTETVAKMVARHPQIQEVRYSNQMVEQLSKMSDMVGIAGLVMVLLFGFATLLIVVNTIRLTVLARETDISIMRLVGATHSFIQWPFVIEGLILGLLGGATAILLLKIGYEVFLVKVGEALPFLPLLHSGPRLTVIFAAVLISGILLTTVGAYFSVHKTLEREG